MYFEEGTMLEILLRLPVMCLLKCMCVCKAWYDLIKSPYFVDLHLKHKSRIDYMIFKARIDGLAAISYCSLYRNNGSLLPMPAPADIPAFPFPPDWMLLSEACNGIFCVMAKELSGEPNTAEVFFLCNPATHKSRRLPNRSLVGDLRGYTCACGLGFDPSTNDYKVVSVFCGGFKHAYSRQSSRSYVHRIWIYSLNSDSWRETEIALPAAIQLGWHSWYGSGLLLNGRLHWMIHDMGIILWFDITNEVMGHIHLPRNVFPKNMNMFETRRNLVLLEHCLALVVIAQPNNDGEASSIFIWTTIDGRAEDSWMERYSISTPISGVGLHPMACWNNDKLLLLDMATDDLVTVDLKMDDECRVETQNASAVEAIVMLKESLVSLR